MPEETKTFDPIEHIKTRNESDHAKLNPPQVEEKPKQASPPAVEKHEEPSSPRLPRSARREMNRLREEAAEARGRASVYEEMVAKGLTPKADGVKDVRSKEKEDPEPERKDFESDAAYNRAVGRWDARQEAKKEVGKVKESTKAEQDNAAWFAHVAEMDKKAVEDIKVIADWQEAQDQALEDAEDDPELKFSAEKQPTFYALIMQSDVRAFVLHHYAKNPGDLKKILAAQPAEQIRMFSRLEGRVEKMYTSDDPKKAAQAKEEPKADPKDRRHPADSGNSDGRNASERDARKPRPSTEVAARGGSAAPDEPPIGSPAWMEKRNQRQYTTRY